MLRVFLCALILLLAGCGANLPAAAEVAPAGADILLKRDVRDGYAILSRHGQRVSVTVVYRANVYQGDPVPIDPASPLPPPLIAGAFGTAYVGGLVQDPRATAVEIITAKRKVIREPIANGAYLIVYPSGDGHANFWVRTLDPEGRILSEWSYGRYRAAPR